MKNAKRLSQRKTLLERNVKANKICKEKKKQWLNNMIKQIEEAHRQNNTRKRHTNIPK